MSKSGAYRWGRFRVKNFRTLLVPCYWKGCIMGLFPYKSSPLPPYFVPSKPRHIYATIMVLIQTIFALIAFHQMDIARAWPKGDVPELIRHNLFLIICTFLCVTTYLYNTRRMELFQSLAGLYARLPKHTFGKIFVNFYMKAVIGFLYMLVYVLMLYDKHPLRILVKEFYVYVVYLIFVMDMIYMNCVVVLRLSFEYINKVLLDAKKFMAINNVCSVGLFFQERKYPMLLAEQKELRKRYNETSDILDFLNETFSVHVMMSVIVSLIEITFGLYFFLLGVVQQKEMTRLQQIWYRHFLYSTIYYIIKLVLMVYACDAATNEAKKTDVVVQNILVFTEDKHMREELQLLSMQVFQRSNKFSGKIFTVDAHLLTSIAGNVTTYLLVLVQYLLTQKPVHNWTVDDDN